MCAVMEVYFYADITPVNFISMNKIVSALLHLGLAIACLDTVLLVFLI